MNEQITKLIIVDDEPIICEGLQKTIDWSSLNVEVMGVAYDGEQALQLITKINPQIVITDIRMEGMDGLQLAEQIKQQYPHISVIIISGYEDFEYARQAMRLQVKDYLLKPVDITELMEVVQKTISRMKEHHTEDHTSEDDMLWFLHTILGKPTITSPSLLLQQETDDIAYVVIVSELAYFSENYINIVTTEREQLQAEWQQLVECSLQTLSAYSVIVFSHVNRLFALVRIDQDAVHHIDWTALLIDKANKGKRIDGQHVRYAISDPFKQLEEVAEISMQVKQMLPYYHLTSEQVITVNRYNQLVQQKKQSQLTDFNAYFSKTLAGILFRQEEAESIAYVAQFFEYVRREKFMPAEVLRLMMEQMTLLRQRLRQSGLELNMLGDKKQQIDISIYNTYEALERLFMEQVELLAEKVEEQITNKWFWAIEKATQYMAEHYNEDIRASDVAAWLNITASHFSSIFKKNTGKSFKEYMNNIRMEQACRLLETTNDKVFEIADQVGYSEYKYFVSIFKQQTGLTPKEYRAMKAGK
ncbi:response regulator [Paenibacillus yanchengensis]|uniref:Response regulator n=1 Tax=Paenibacillus yanchengensis TaxID=2035833 RepID=A0ABW4YH78_9BACL